MEPLEDKPKSAEVAEAAPGPVAAVEPNGEESDADAADADPKAGAGLLPSALEACVSPPPPAAPPCAPRAGSTSGMPASARAPVVSPERWLTDHWAREEEAGRGLSALDERRPMLRRLNIGEGKQ